MIDLKPGDLLVVERLIGAAERHEFTTVEGLVRFLRAQRSGSSWSIRHMRGDYQVKPGYLWPMKVIDTYRGQFLA